MSGLTQQRLGAQVEAARLVEGRQTDFTAAISSVDAQAQTLLASYRGAGAVAFTALMGQWLADARAIVGEFDGFAGRLVMQDSTTSASQDEQAQTFTHVASSIGARLG